MNILWRYLKPYHRLILLSLGLAGASQLLRLVDPIIFGKILDEYALKLDAKPEGELVSGVLQLLAIAVGVALLSMLTKALQEYVVQMVVQRFGVQIFNDGIRQTLRLSYQEFMSQRSGETLSVLQKVRTDTERFINASINILFSSLVGIGFLVWYSVTKHWALVQQDQDGAAEHQSRDQPDVGGDHRVAAEHRAGEEPGAHLPGDSPAPGSQPRRRNCSPARYGRTCAS